MSNRASDGGDVQASKVRIDALELRIRERQEAIGQRIHGIIAHLRGQLIAPTTLISAGLFGVAIHRSQRARGIRLLAILHAANTGLRRVEAVKSRVAPSVD